MSIPFYDPRFDGTRSIAQAVNFQGKPYTGALMIEPGKRGGHHLQWRTNAGDYEGMGLVMDGRMWLAFGRDAGYGLAVYAPAGNGLESVFTGSELKGAIGTERIEDCRDWMLQEKIYEMKGKSPDGGTYHGQWAVKPYGEVFLMSWTFAGSPGQLVGVGMHRHDRLVVGYGHLGDYTFGCGCYELQPDGTMEGHWATPSLQKVGLEVFGPARPS